MIKRDVFPRPCQLAWRERKFLQLGPTDSRESAFDGDHAQLKELIHQAGQAGWGLDHGASELSHLVVRWSPHYVFDSDNRLPAVPTR